MNDKSSPLYWFDKPLRYTDHAIFRSFERYIPLIHFLPLNAKFEGMREDAYCFSYRNQVSKVYIAISDSGAVITTYYMKVNLNNKIRLKPRMIKPSKYPHKEIELALMEYA
jgi:hypothetical protein